MTKKSKLTFLQNGSLQRILVIFVPVLFMMISVIYCTEILKLTLLPMLSTENFFDKEIFMLLLAILGLSFVCALITGYIIYKIIIRLNVVVPVTLPKVIELSKALENIFIDDFESQAQCSNSFRIAMSTAKAGDRIKFYS